MPNETVQYPATSDKSLAQSLNYIGVRPIIKFDGRCLKQDKTPFTHKKVVKYERRKKLVT